MVNGYSRTVKHAIYLGETVPLYRIYGKFSIDIEADSEEDALEIYDDGAYDASELDLETDEIFEVKNE
jgi:hypothetical protein